MWALCLALCYQGQHQSHLWFALSRACQRAPRPLMAIGVSRVHRACVRAYRLFRTRGFSITPSRGVVGSSQIRSYLTICPSITPGSLSSPVQVAHCNQKPAEHAGGVRPRSGISGNSAHHAECRALSGGVPSSRRQRQPERHDPSAALAGKAIAKYPRRPFVVTGCHNLKLNRPNTNGGGGGGIRRPGPKERPTNNVSGKFPASRLDE